MLRSLARGSLTAAALLVGAGAAQAGWEEGLAAFKGGDLGAAATEFQGVVTDKPDWYGGYFMLGQVRLMQNQNQEALTHLRKAYDLNPSELSIQLPLGKAYIAAGQFNDAARLLSSVDASKLAAGQQGALYQMLAVAHGRSGRSDEAAAALAKAVAANPNDAQVQFQYGTTALNAGDTAAAVKALEKAATLDSGDADMQRAYIQALLRSGRENTGAAKDQAYQKAVTVAKALSARDASYETLLLQGEAELGADSYPAAAATFQQAAAKNPADWLPHFYIGQAQTASGNYGPAEAALKQSLKVASSAQDQTRIWKQLGFVYEKQKNYSSARSAYQQAGDSAAVQRVAANEETEKFNEQVEADTEKIQQIEEERRKLEEQLKDLPGGPPPPRETASSTATSTSSTSTT